jgi:hypothetical protein
MNPTADLPLLALLCPCPALPHPTLASLLCFALAPFCFALPCFILKILYTHKKK